MVLVFGALCLSFSILFFFVTLLGCRNPKNPKWASEGLVCNLYIPVIIGLGAVGVGIVIHVVTLIGSHPIEGGELILAGAALAVVPVLVKMLGIYRTLARYEAETRRARSEKVDFPTEPAVGDTRFPKKPFRKAA